MGATLVDQLYAYNRRLTALGGQMLRLAERHKVPRKDFIDRYIGHELDEQWIPNLGKLVPRTQLADPRRCDAHVCGAAHKNCHRSGRATLHASHRRAWSKA